MARFGGVCLDRQRFVQQGDVSALRRWHDWWVAGRASPRGPGLWEAVDALIDRAPSEDDLRGHRLEVLAARRYRALGRPVPPDFVLQERLAAIASLTAPAVLELVRAAYHGPAMVLKGPEIAARYPDPALRVYGDIDLLVPDAEEAHQAMLAAGFKLVGDPALYVDIHHLRPLLAAGVPLAVEIHSRPKWLDPLTPPTAPMLFESAQPSATGVPGMLAPSPAQHAVLLAVHSWAHEPLRRIRDMIDVAVIASSADPAEIDELARAWGVRRLWRTTITAVDALLGEERKPWALRIWAQNLDRTRDRTVLEFHLQRWLSDFWAMPSPAAARRLPRTLMAEIGPEGNESWRDKLSRTALALKDARRRRSQHDRELQDRSQR
ncbi:MAG: putative nucleotidyltransferase [Gaiellaceae bacterium]|nr:putative nucleotidyltransferase [Gaiellaceae bacterium]